jgi:hypothetical protein
MKDKKILINGKKNNHILLELRMKIFKFNAKHQLK